MSQVTEEDLVSLDTLAGGAAVERFNDELAKVFANILDPNTPAGARNVVLTVTIKPKSDSARNRCSVDFTAKSKILPAMAVSTELHLGVDPKRGAVAVEYDPGQLRLFTPPATDSSKIVNFQQAKGE